MTKKTIINNVVMMNKTLEYLMDQKDEGGFEIPLDLNDQHAIYINKSGLYALVFGNKKN